MPIGPDLKEVRAFVTERFGDVNQLEELQRGGWSSAYAFVSASGDERVIRFGRHREDFEKERIAAQWRGRGLPIPEVYELGDAFDGAFVVSKRYYGDKLADVDGGRTDAIVTNLFEVLRATRSIDLP